MRLLCVLYFLRVGYSTVILFRNPNSPHAPFQRDGEQFLCFHGKLHGQFAQHVLGVAVHYQPYGALLRYAALLAVEKLVFGYFRCGGFVFEHCRLVANFYVWPSVCAAGVAKQQRVALRVVSCPVGVFGDVHQSAVAVLAVSGGDAFRNDGAVGVFAQMYHFGSRVGLLVVVGNGHGVELCRRVVAL